MHFFPPWSLQVKLKKQERLINNHNKSMYNTRISKCSPHPPFFFFIYQTLLSVLCLYYEKQKVTVLHVITSEMLREKLCCQQVKKCGSAALKTTTFYFKALELNASIKKTEHNQQIPFRNQDEDIRSLTLHIITNRSSGR